MIERLKLLLDYYNLTSSNFAEKIDVPRSSISHLLSGRNKPSLDFIIKVDNAFEEVDLDWLLYGKGTFPKSTDIETNTNSESKETPSLFNQKPSTSKHQNENSDDQQRVSTVQKNKVATNELKKLIKVILLYNDGTFEEFDK